MILISFLTCKLGEARLSPVPAAARLRMEVTLGSTAVSALRQTLHHPSANAS